jgi:ubiquinone/menaquinone biosynthesis C-methylase UbiE
MNNQSGSANYADVTTRQKDTWATGDFNQIARQNVVMAEPLCEAVELRAGQRVLDVACGSGTAALVAARRYCEVTGIDFVPELVERARVRAEAEGLDGEFHVGDAQQLPFPDKSFDAVISVYGVNFAPDQEKAATEMLRVCRPGGRIGLASPVPEGWSGDFFATNARYIPPPPGIKSPLRWGTAEGIDELFGASVRTVRNEKRTALQYFRSVDHAVEVFLTYFGPAIKASRTDKGHNLRDDLKAVFNRYNRATDGTAVIENTYMLTMAVRDGS